MWFELMRARTDADGLRIETGNVYDGHFFLPVVSLAPRGKKKMWANGSDFPGPWKNSPPRNQAERDYADPLIRAEVEAEWGELLVAARARLRRELRPCTRRGFSEPSDLDSAPDVGRCC
jgi:hypothetical protein